MSKKKSEKIIKIPRRAPDPEVLALQEKLGKKQLRAVVYCRPKDWTDNPLSMQTIMYDIVERNNIDEIGVQFDTAEGLTGLPITKGPGFKATLSQCLHCRADVVIVLSRAHSGNTTAEYLEFKSAFAVIGVEILFASDTQIIDSPMMDDCKVAATYLLEKAKREA